MVAAAMAIFIKYVQMIGLDRSEFSSYRFIGNNCFDFKWLRSAMDTGNSPALNNLSAYPAVNLPARNSLEFLQQVFSLWREKRLFSMSRDISGISNSPLISIDYLTKGAAGRDALDIPTDSRGWGRFDYHAHLSDDPAQIVYSSGTEGRPKGIVISHRNLADVTTRLNAVMAVNSDIREYIGVPVTYSFGLGRARAVAAAGGSLFLPERFDPLEIRDMLAADQINAVSAVPSLWRQVLAAPGVIGALGTRMRWIEIGSQYMSAADKMALRELFPNARIVQHYGLTEASRSTFLDISAADPADMESVGQAMGKVQMRITDEGAIALRGDHVALGVLDDNGLIQPLTDADGWLTTRDRGEIRNGHLYYLGRLDDQINVGGVKLPAEGLEARIRALVPAAGDSIAVAPVPDPGRGEAVLLAIEKSVGDHTALIEEAARLILTRSGIAVGPGVNAPLKVLYVDQLPRTGTDKIQRRLLPALWQQETARAALGSDLVPDFSDDMSEAETRLATIWAGVVGNVPMTPRASFYDLGGDSLSSIQIGLVMESAGLPRAAIRATFEGRSLREAAALISDPADTDVNGSATGPVTADLTDAARRSWAITMARAVMALSVLISHWGPGFFGVFGVEGQAEGALSLIYRMGTPSFAAIFGIGIGYFMLPDFRARRGSVLRRMDASFRLVLFGLVLLAAFDLANLLVRDEAIGGLELANAFYGVLAYYALMLGTARLWLPVLARSGRQMQWLPLAFPLLWLIWQAMPGILPAHQLHSVLEWPRLMLSSGYNVFKMTAITVLGIAIGLWLSHQTDSRRAARILILSGIFGMVLPILTLIEAHGPGVFESRNSPVFTSLPGLFFYLSVVAFAIGLFLHLLLSWETLSGPARLPLKWLLVIGGLALPIYVFHGLVIPGRDLLAGLGLSGKYSLMLAMGSFLAVMVWLGRRLWRMYFA